MNRKGKIAMQILIMLIVVVITSAVVFLLVQYRVIDVKEMEGASVLNIEFIPYMREGFLVVNNFMFCGFVDENYNCMDEKEDFNLGDRIYFRFIVESSTIDGEIILVQNYQLRGPAGEVLLAVDERYNNYFRKAGNEIGNKVYFKDYIISEEKDPLGEYTLELFIENPPLNKKLTLIKKFNIV